MADTPKFRHYRRFEPGIFSGVASTGLHRGKLVLNADTLTSETGGKTRPARFSPINLREFGLEPERRYQITLWRKTEHNSRLLEAEPLPDPAPKPDPLPPAVGLPEPVALDIARALARLLMHDPESMEHVAAIIERLSLGSRDDGNPPTAISLPGVPRDDREPEGRPRGPAVVGGRKSRQTNRSRVRKPTQPGPTS